LYHVMKNKILSVAIVILGIFQFGCLRKEVVLENEKFMEIQICVKVIEDLAKNYSIEIHPKIYIYPTYVEVSELLIEMLNSEHQFMEYQSLDNLPKISVDYIFRHNNYIYVTASTEAGSLSASAWVYIYRIINRKKVELERKFSLWMS
jgi:hypothetical protein